jgi:hypothetical protein
MSKQLSLQSKDPLKFESLEDRRMLAIAADIIFLVDESGSGTDTSTQEWLQQIVTGDLINDSDDIQDMPSFFDQLSVNGIDDVRYGIVGFGQINRFSHSQLFAGSSKIGDPSQLTTAQLNAAFAGLVSEGGLEDGWDAIEHVIAEYDFRPGAVPMIVFVQDDEGRIDLNETLTHEGVLAALKSKNVILNSIVVGNGVLENNGEAELFEWYPLADLSPYVISPDIRVLGIEADMADGVRDRQHDYHWIDTNTINSIVDTITATESDALQVSYNGSNTGATGMVGSRNSILIGQNLIGGIGDTTPGYSAKSIPFEFLELVNPTTFSSPISYSFDFYGSRTQVWADEDGLLRFTSSDVSGSNADLSQLAPSLIGEPAPPARPNQAIIAALWDDLAPATSNGLSGRIEWEKRDLDGDAQDDLIVQWTDYRYVDDVGTHDPINFQAVLYADGMIRFNYLDLESFPSNDADQTVNETGGISATVGIWSGAADDITIEVGKLVPGLHRIDGAVFEFVGNSITPGRTVDTNDSYIRMAWDTGGAVWDLGVIDEYAPSISPATFQPYGINSPEANELRDAFFESLDNQIIRANSQGKVFRADQMLLALNLGNTTVDINAGTAGMFRRDNGVYTAPVGGGADTGAVAVDSHTSLNSVNVSSTNSIPTGTTSSIFQSARGEEAFADSISENISFTIDKLDINNNVTTLVDGTYIVELFFAEHVVPSESTSRIFDVRLEGVTMLNDYDIFNDRARITNFGSSTTELESAMAGTNTGIVKRFEIDVTGNDGLQIDLIREAGSSLDPILNAVRILRADPPRIDNVVLKGSTWAAGVDYAFDQLVGLGQQLRPVATQDVDTLEIHFSGPVDVDEGNNLRLAQTVRTVSGSVTNMDLDSGDFSFVYDPVNYIGIWTFHDPLPDGKFAIHLTGVTDGGGQLLDSEWTNEPGYVNGEPTWDNYLDDPQRPFITGDGIANTEGNEFRFHFALQAGDYNGDGVVTTADTVSSSNRYSDGNGDGLFTTSGIDSDISVRTANLNERLPMSELVSADFNQDERVDGADLLIWQTGYSEDMAGDADGDGDSDGRDFLIWQRMFGTYTAWADAPVGQSYAEEFAASLGLTLEELTVGLTPQVMNVIISGSASVHAPFSFDTVDGSGSQLATVPVGLADTISLVFSEDVNVSAASLIVVGMTTANVPTLAEFEYDALTYTATWRFEGWALGDNYLLHLTDSITDVDGNFLDGEWTNPASRTTTNSLVSEFPSGDGVAGGNFVFVMTLLPGDANRDNVVNLSDWYIISANMAPSGIQKQFTQGDFNGDGVVNGSDAQLFSTYSGTNLQTPWILADLDEDNDVDDDDFAILRTNYGMTGADWEDGDLNDDNVVDDLDLDLAFAQYGLWLNSVA